MISLRLFFPSVGLCLGLHCAAVAAPDPAPAAAQPEAKAPIDPAKLADVRSLLRLLGYDGVGSREVAKLVGAYQKKLPRVPGDTWSKVKAELKPESLDEALAAIYDQALTHEEIKLTIAFYDTPAGRKIAQLTPMLASQSAQTISAWQHLMTNQLHTILNSTVGE
jgi:uncharacterized protein